MSIRAPGQAASRLRRQTAQHGQHLPTHPLIGAEPILGLRNHPHLHLSRIFADFVEEHRAGARQGRLAGNQESEMEFGT